MVREPDATRQPSPPDIQLMSKHRVLSSKPQLRLEWRGQDGQNETEQPDHSASLGDSITASTQIRFTVPTVYYSQFDQHIQALVSPSDYFSSALLWLPYVAVIYFVLTALTVLQWRLEDFRYFRRGRPVGKSYDVLGALVILIAIDGFFVTPPPGVWYSYGLAASYVWA